MALRNEETLLVVLFWRYSARKRFLSITTVCSTVCGGVVLIGTSANTLFPLKKRYSPSIFQKEMLDKRFRNRVKTTLTKKRDRSRF
jgi:hypothetical protein